MREPVIRFALVLVLAPLCAIVGEASFGNTGLLLGWILALSLISSFGLWSARQIWQEISANPKSALLKPKIMVAIGAISILSELTALMLLLKLLTDWFW
ncbi:MAG: hypothetical protein ACUVR4_12735 [Anaerolineae bacterium]